MGCRCNCFASLRHCAGCCIVIHRILNTRLAPPCTAWSSYTCTTWWTLWNTSCYGLTDGSSLAGNASRRPWLLRLIEMDWNGLNWDCSTINLWPTLGKVLPVHHQMTLIPIKLACILQFLIDFNPAPMQCQILSNFDFVHLFSFGEFPLGLPARTGCNNPSRGRHKNQQSRAAHPYYTISYQTTS